MSKTSIARRNYKMDIHSSEGITCNKEVYNR